MDIREFRIWRPGDAELEADKLDKLTPAELLVGRDPGMVQYILDLRFQRDLWRQLFNQKLEEKSK